MQSTLVPNAFFSRIRLMRSSVPVFPVRILCCTAILMASIASAVIATPALADPPARVGRIGLVEGDVSFYNDKTEGWRQARLNFPVTSKNSIWTNSPGRAEVSIGASALRLDGDSIVDFSRVDDSRTQVYLQRGTLNVRLRSYPGQQSDVETYRDTFRVETDEGVVILQSNGRYRFDASQDRNETRISVFAGMARFDNGGAALNVEAGKSLIVRINGGSPSFSFDLASEQPFDRWAEARDINWDSIHQRYANERNVSPRMTGYEDLDTYGDWMDDREYGRLWSPRVIVDGWAPYRYGSWSYVRPWGWTWVDDSAWGFAPFHYGRWVFRSARWYWWPGAYSYRPVYAPALVGWAGRGNWNVSLSIGGGSVGWFPLAPREYYVPAYSNNVTYIRNINNVTNNITVINPPSTFANQVPGATVVNNGVMVNGEPVWRNASINNQQAVSMIKPAVDTRSIGSSGSSGSNAAPPANNLAQLGQASLAPPPAPQAVASVSRKPQALATPSAAPLVVNGQAVQAQQPQQPQQAMSPRSVVGEAPRAAAQVAAQPQSSLGSNFGSSKPAQASGSSTTAQVAQEPPAFVRPVKPNPTVANATISQEPIKQQGQSGAPQPRFDSPAANIKKPGLLSDTQFDTREQRVEGGAVAKEQRAYTRSRQEVRQEARQEARQQAGGERNERNEGHVKQKPQQDKAQSGGGKVGHAHQGEVNNKVSHQ
jgi:hypothetical protein